MIVWSGFDQNGDFNDGGRYNLTANSWTALAITGAPSPRQYGSAVWTGSEMLVFGGLAGSNLRYDTFSYAPDRTTYLYQRP